MTKKEFDKLTKQDFENDTVKDEIRKSLPANKLMSEKRILEWLLIIESDERLHCKSVDIFTNAPLALEQITIETKSDVLRTILGMPLCFHNPNGKPPGKWEPRRKS